LPGGQCTRQLQAPITGGLAQMNARTAANVSAARWSTPLARTPQPVDALAGGGSVGAARPTGGPRLLAALVLVVVLAIGALSLAWSAGQRPGHSLAAAHTLRGWGAAPLPARLAVSRGLGANNSRYWMRDRRGSVISVDNPAQRLSASLSAGAVRVHGADGVNVGLAAASVGRGSTRTALGRAVLTGSARNRATFAASGVQEWYSNGPYGLEQGFVVSRRPAGARGELTLSQVISGNASVRLDVGADAATFSSAHGSLLYGGLIAIDARGRRLAARLTVHGNQLGIAVDDRDAVYPVTIDPGFAEVAKLSDSASSYLGYDGLAVSASGDTIVAGDYADHLWVYTKPVGGWTSTTAATAELSYSPADDYLSNVAISGDGNTIVAGAGDETVSAHTDQGAVFVYTKPAGGWASTSTTTAELTATDGAASDYLGSSVAVSENGGTIVAGAYQHTPVGGNSKQGAVYEYTMPGGGWASTSTPTAELTASNGAMNDYLGVSAAVSADGGTIVAGAYYANSAAGAAYVWTMPGGGWASTSAYTAELTGASASAYAGSTVGISGDTIAVGAGYATTSAATYAGAVYVYTMPGGGWATTNTPTAELTASDGSYEAYLGYYSLAVSDSGDMIVAGTDLSSAGAMYSWTKPAGGWANATQTQELTEPGGGYFAYMVAAAGSTLVAAAPYTGSDLGTLYVFGPAAPPTASPTLHNFGTQPRYTYGAPESFNVTNPNAGSLTSTSFSIAGADPDDFVISSSTCSGTLAGGASCSVHVRFGPTVSGARGATLVESDSVNGGPTTLATLTGTGGSLPQGPTGKTGARGKPGKTGKPGKVELVTCTTKGKHKKCKTKLVSSPVKFRTSTARATLSRGGTIYASGDATLRHGTRRLTLHASRPLRAGRYTLTLTYRSGRRIRTTMTIA
jgi:hypothetical protein